jgi:hypothetical protein
MPEHLEIYDDLSAGGVRLARVIAAGFHKDAVEDPDMQVAILHNLLRIVTEPFNREQRLLNVARWAMQPEIVPEIGFVLVVTCLDALPDAEAAAFRQTPEYIAFASRIG